ncbi:hypothetical protein NE237_018312 [Protea cynaroides]|uniref:GATA-type domain-containing protein n=1 Tax=Protea cynaroides TaxID=273540 RepID=A0A9Q0QNW4_9MAGN|nr:hypothetical protein NE237_018312 [Protea cynaroides]
MAIHESYKRENQGFLDFNLDDLEVEEKEFKPMEDFNDFGSFPAIFNGFSESQLCIPDDPLDDLEWFPNFTNEPISLSGIPTSPETESVLFGGFPKTPERETEENSKKKGFEGYLRQVIHSKKPRSKRVGGRGWASVKSSLSDSSLSPENWPEVKVVMLGRRCSHCQVEKTPQWRAGPMGPKTLCNACGVRYKSGRLVPEYRPAASPSFNEDMHSNSHRKIMKMREFRR